MAFSILGTGTQFYGERDFRTDGTYVTTVWITIVFIPVVPLYSLRVAYRDSGLHGSLTLDRFEICERMRPNGRQVLYTYAFVVIAGAWGFLVALVMATFPSDAVASPPGMFASILALGLPIPIPWLLRRRAIRRVFEPEP